MEHVHPLRAYRKNQQPPLSQKQLADMLGVDRVTVARWEAGTRNVDQERLPAIAERTGIAPAKLRPDLMKLLNAPQRGAERR